MCNSNEGMNKHVLIFLFLSLMPLLSGQTPDIKFERFGFKQGLYDSGFDNIMQDRKGFIWIGHSRVCKFDGYKFNTLEDLPHSKVYPADTVTGVSRMFEDTLGLIWIVYGKGIVLFNPEDGRSIKLKDSYPRTDPYADSLGFDWTTAVYTMKLSGNCFWLATRAGLLRLTYKKGISESTMKGKIFSKEFKEIIDVDTFKIRFLSLPAYYIDVIYEDNWKNIWVGCKEGLYFMKNGSRSFEMVNYDEKGRCRLPASEVEFIVQENENSFLIGSWYGLFRMSNVKNALMCKNPDKSMLEFHTEKLFVNATAVFKDRNSNIYVASDQNIFLVKRDSNNAKYSFIPLYKNITGKDGDRFSSVASIMQDHEGTIWVGQAFNGLLKFKSEDIKFIDYKNVFSGVDNNKRNATFLLEDSQGRILTGGERIYKITPGNSKTISFKISTATNFLDCISEIKPDIFWIGRFKGVSEFNARTGQIYDPIPRVFAGFLYRSQVWDLLKDGNLEYICADYGIFVYDFLTRKLRLFNVDPPGEFKRIVKSNDGSIWAVTTSVIGLYKLHYDQTDERMSFSPLNYKNLSEQNLLNSINDNLFADSEGFLWVGNDNKYGNLHRVNPVTGEIKSYNLNKQQRYAQITSINEDNHNNLWLGTSSGLTRFNKLTGEVKIFTEDDGLPLSTHSLHSVIRSKDGRLFFGGKTGFYSFNPDSLKINNSIPRIVITDFRLFNKSVHPNSLDNDILKKDIAYTNQIELNYKQNDITFEFAALDFSNPMDNKYAYKLEGYKNEWVNTDAANRLATFTNLSPGTYTFIVKGSNNDGVWNEEGTSLRIVIHKPWYGTIAAWVIYILLFAAATGGFIMWRLSSLKREKIKLENQVQERTHQIEIQKEEILAQRNLVEEQYQQIIELDQLRTRFFTNISHEFRTPLALIQSPVEELLEDPRRNERERKKLSMVQRNAGRLLTLVNQLLDISKMDGSRMKLELVEGDVMKHLSGLVKNFTSLAELKSIMYEIRLNNEAFITWYDPDKLEKIVVNLLSNAFKFTPEGGNISFSAGYIKSNDRGISNYLEFSVADTGTGIPEASLDKIFDRFYQVESSVKKEGGGTGIGLSLARDMARLMHGDIIVKSELCRGSVFSVKVPLGKDFLNAGEFIILKKMPSGYSLQHDLDKSLFNNGNEGEEESPASGKPILLIVEDNMDIRLQLRDNLSESYHIIEAIDGIAGFKKATETIPDLIITDIMMPRMDGSEMCHKLKNDERTSHIPVIMLTAKVTHNDKITGYDKGADDYIPKPFLMAELKARAANLLQQRQKLRERYSREIKLEPTDVLITPLDEKFLKRAMEIVETHINEDDFDLVKFRAEMNMSRSTLFRKLHALTGESPTDFIRNIRLKRAADLLKKKFGNVTQVSFEVGFSNLSYFNKSFRKLYGVTPTEYSKKYS
jgi:signal transduction histidine kinase/DNA-binding response OmpR family regulator/ligand-binding sensor domain-containing protein